MKTVTMKEISDLAKEKTIQTMCDGCVFAEYEEVTGPTSSLPTQAEGRLSQTGCKLQRFDKFAENGAEILKVEDEKQESDFVVIQGRICNMLRGIEWKAEALRKDKDDLYALARKEVLIQCTFLIYLGPGQSIEDAYETAQKIQKQEVPPTHIIIINNSGIMPASFLREWKRLQITSSEILEIPWSMEYIVEFQYQEWSDILDNATEEEKKQLQKDMFFRCLDVGVKKVETLYYALFNAGDSIPTNYLSDIDKVLNDDLIRILALDPKNDSHSGLFMHAKLHTQIGGNKERPCIDKVITQTENQECPNLVLPTKKIVKNFDLQ
jgi:hypothetical protein